MPPFASQFSSGDRTAPPTIDDLAVVAARLRTAIATGDTDTLGFLADELDRHALWGARDPLTGLWTRSAIRASVQHRAARPLPDDWASDLAVVVIVLHDLRAIAYATQGHEAVRQHVAACAAALRAVCDPLGLLIMHAQEDVFVVFDERQPTAATVAALTDQLRAALTALGAQVSLGVSLKRPAWTVDDTLRAADHTLADPSGIWDEAAPAG